MQVQVQLCRSSESLQQEYVYSCSLFAMATANWSDTGATFNRAMGGRMYTATAGRGKEKQTCV